MTCKDCKRKDRRSFLCKIGFHDFDNTKCYHERPIKCKRQDCTVEKDFGVDC